MFSNYNFENYTYFIETRIRAANSIIEPSLLSAYNKKYIFNETGSISFNSTSVNSFPIDTDILIENNAIKDNENILRVISLAKEIGLSYVVTTDVKKNENNILEIVYYLIDMHNEYRIYEISARILIDMDNLDDHQIGIDQKIAKEIIDLFDEID